MSKLPPTITVELTVEQLINAIRSLAPNERVMFFQLVKDQFANEIAAEALLSDYLNDKELTAFTSLDAEPFHTED